MDATKTLPMTQRAATLLLNKLGKERAELCGRIGRFRAYGYQGSMETEEAKAKALLEEMKDLQAYGATQGWNLYHDQLFTLLNRSR